MKINYFNKFFTHVSDFLLLFLFLIGPIFNSISPILDSILIISFLLFVVNIFNYSKIPNYIVPFFIIFLSVTFSLFQFIYFSPSVPIYQLVYVYFKPLKILLTLFGGYYLARHFCFRYGPSALYYFLLFLIYAIGLHSIIMIFQFFDPEFKDLIYSYTTNGVFNGTFEYNFRPGGISGATGGSVLSVFHSLGSIFTLFIYNKSAKIVKYILIFINVLIFFSIIICGRSGILNLLIFIPISYFIIFKHKTKIIVNLIIIFSVLLITYLVIFFNMNTIDNEFPELSLSLRRNLDFLFSFTDDSYSRNTTLDVVQTMYIFPKDPFTLFLGNANYIVNSQQERVLQSDVGFIKDLWSYGLCGTLVSYIPLFWIMYKYKKMFTNISFKLACLVISIMFFFHTKEIFVYTRMFMSVISFLFAIIHIESTKYRIVRTPIFKLL